MPKATQIAAKLELEAKPLASSPGLFLPPCTSGTEQQNRE